MHKHHQNLERLYQKLKLRYGQDDELVIQVKHEIDSNEIKQSRSRPKANQSPQKERKEESSALTH